MFRKLLSSLIVIFISLNSYGQQSSVETENGKRLLYYFKEPGFLVPYIEDVLKNMTISSEGEGSTPYFNEIESFNRVKGDFSLQSEMAEIVWSNYNARALIDPSIRNNTYYNEISNTILEYNYFLTIKTNTLGELIEFQFELFLTDKEVGVDNKTNIRQGTYSELLNVENFFINPSGNDYLKEIENALYRLFDGGNEPPRARVSLLRNTYDRDSEINIPKGDTVIIDLKKSFDLDTEELTYYWKNIPVDKEYYQHLDKINFKEGEPTQRIAVDDTKPRRIQVWVNDGINDSDPIKILLVPKNKPIGVKVPFNNYSIIEYLTTKKTEISLKRESSFDFYEEINSANDSIVISKKPLGKVFNKKIDGQDIVTFEVIEKDTIYDSKIRNRIELVSEFEDVNKIGLAKYKKEYFLYSVNRDSILSTPIKLSHNYIERGSFTVRVGFAVYAFEKSRKFRERYPEQDSLNSLHSAIPIELGIDLNKNIEAGIFINIPVGDDVNVNQLNFVPYPVFGTGFNYRFIPLNSNKNRLSPFIGIEGGCTTFLTDEEIADEERNPEVETTRYIYSYGLRVGGDYKLELSWSSLLFRVKLNYGQFNKSALDYTSYSGLEFDIGFKF